MYQNKPNPFKDETTIGFSLPEKTMAKLSIYDVSGAEVYTVEGEFEKGYNTIDVSKSLLDSFGIHHYELKTRNNIDIKSMIIMK